MEDAKKIVWSSEYETGVDDIDEQHQILVNTINEASQKLGEDASVESLETITRDLLSYALYHFEEEEEMMQKYDYKAYSLNEYESHMKQHRDFSAKVVAIRESIKEGNPICKDELIEFLTNWLINHINKTDKKLGAYICSQK